MRNLWALLKSGGPPTFVVGFPRSGTTLMQAQLCALRGMVSFPETHYFEYVAAGFRPTGGYLSREDAVRLLDGLQKYIDVPSAEELGEFGEKVPVGGLFKHIVAWQLIKSGMHKKAVRWVEKTPGHALFIPRLASMFPKAKFIYTVRHPADAFASRRAINNEGTTGWGEPWRPVEIYCAEWQQYLNAASSFQSIHPERLLFVKLEDLVTDADRTMARVCKFIDHDGSQAEAAPEKVLNSIAKPWETWKEGADQAPSPALADRSGRYQLSSYERWRVSSLLLSELKRFDYVVSSNKAVARWGAKDQRIMLRTIDWFASVHPLTSKLWLPCRTKK